MSPIKNVLFVCTANVCRSPMAEAMFIALAQDRVLDCRAESAGVRALVGEPIAPRAGTVLEETGIYAEGHRARQVSEDMLLAADLVLAMEPRHIAELHRVAGSSFEVYTLPSYAKGVAGEEGVVDPYGSNMTAHRACARQLLEHVNLLLNRLEN